MDLHILSTTRSINDVYIHNTTTAISVLLPLPKCSEQQQQRIITNQLATTPITTSEHLHTKNTAIVHYRNNQCACSGICTVELTAFLHDSDKNKRHYIDTIKPIARRNDDAIYR